MIWFACKIGGQKWTIEIVDPKDPRLNDEGEDERYALCIPEQCLILVSNELGDEAKQFYLLHELDHAVNDACGASYELGLLVPDADEHGKLEERLVRARTPVWLSLLKSLGLWFPLPPVPYVDQA